MTKFCANCRRTILSGSMSSSIMGSTYHSHCLYCNKCGDSLWEKSFVRKKDGRLYCETGCEAPIKLLPPISNAFLNSNISDLKRKINNISLPALNIATNADNNDNQDTINTARSELDNEKTAKSLSSQGFSKKEETDYYNYTLLPVINNNNNNQQTNDNVLTVPQKINRLNNNSNASHRKLDEIVVRESDEVICDKCDEPVEKDKYTFNKKNFHKQCFTCTKCDCELYRMKKVHKSANDSWGMYCEPCYNEKFGPKCAKCNQPVTPYMLSSVFEDKIFHKECFVCQRCKKSLLKDKFFKTGNLIICKSCF